MLEVVIASRNHHKVREIASLLALRQVRWRSLEEFPSVGEVAETGRTFEANAVKKARAAARATQRPALADDSGLEVDALGGRPGVRSARFAGRHGDDAANNAKLLRALAGMPPARRGAQYRCVLALAGPSGSVAVARGAWRGRIAQRLAGREGFGYDPLFLVPRLGKTVGQLSASTKQRLSHRARAARVLRPALQRLVRQAGSGATAGRRVAAAARRRLLRSAA